FQHKSVAAKFDDVLPTSRMAEKAGHVISRQDTLPSASISVIGFSGELRPIHRRYPFEVYSEMFGLGALKGQSLGRAVQIDNQDRALLCCDTLGLQCSFTALEHCSVHPLLRRDLCRIDRSEERRVGKGFRSRCTAVR